MKVISLGFVLCISLALPFGVKSQGLPDMNDELHQLFSGLNKPGNKISCQSNFLWDMATEISSDYNGTIGIKDPGVSFDWFTQHQEFYFRSYTKGLLPLTRQVKTEAEDLYNSSRKIAIGIMDFSYYEFTDDAFDVQGQYFDWDDNSIWDVSGRSKEPYKELTPGEYNLTFFKCAPLRDYYHYRKIIFTFSPRFSFYDQQYSCFYKQIPVNEFQVNFGSGWQTINTSNLTDTEIEYPKKGRYEIKFRIFEDGNVLRECSSFIEITTDDLEPKQPSSSMDFSGMNIAIYNECDEHLQYKPLIYVSGIDLTEMKNELELYDEFFEKGNLAELINYGYRIYVVDWKNSRISLADNANNLKNLITKINNDMKAQGNPNQIVILGSSIGGIISRYALTSMETPAGASHNCRLLVTLDSPHQGANVSIGIQNLVNTLVNLIPPPLRLTTFLLDELTHSGLIVTELLDQTGVKQMLVYHISQKTILGEYPITPERQQFLNELYLLNPATNGYPTQCRVVLISNGMLDGTPQDRFGGGPTKPGDLLFGVGSTIKVKIFKKIYLPIWDWSVDIRSTPDGFGQTNHLPSAFKSLKIIGCFRSIMVALWHPSTFLSAVRGCIHSLVYLGDDYALNTKPIDDISGGDVSFVRSGSLFPSISIGPLSAFTGIVAENQSPSFVRTSSALDYGGPKNGNMIEHINFTQMPVSQIVNSTGAHVFIGSPGNWTHNQWGAKPDQPYLANLFIKPKEIAPDHMKLDNYNLSRRAYFESRFIIEAGSWLYDQGTTHEYTYPSSLSLDYNKPLSKENGFSINQIDLDISMPPEWSYVTFRSGKEIILKPGFSSTYNSRFHAVISAIPFCHYDSEENIRGNIKQMDEIFTHSIKSSNSTQDTFINDNNISEKVFLFPNPAQTNLTVRIHANKPEKPIVQVFSLHGKDIILSDTGYNMNENVISLTYDISKLKSGIYIFKIHTSTQNYIRRIIISN